MASTGGLLSKKDRDLKTLGQQVSTAPIANDANPVWNQGFVLAVRNPTADVLRVRVYDHDSGNKDDMIGEAFMPLLGLAASSTSDQWVQLNTRNSKTAIDGAIHLRMSMAMPGQTQTAGLGQIAGCAFQCSVIEARNIARKDLASPSDPYIKLSLVSSRHTKVVEKKHLFRKNRSPTGQELRTNACPNTTTPVWNETFQMISCDPMDDQLRVLCYDSDTGKDDFIGEAIVPLTGLAQGNVSDLWVRLNGKVAQHDGSVHLLIKPVQHPLISYPASGLGSQQMLQQQPLQQQQFQQQTQPIAIGLTGHQQPGMVQQQQTSEANVTK